MVYVARRKLDSNPGSAADGSKQVGSMVILLPCNSFIAWHGGNWRVCLVKRQMKVRMITNELETSLHVMAMFIWVPNPMVWEN